MPPPRIISSKSLFRTAHEKLQHVSENAEQAIQAGVSIVRTILGRSDYPEGLTTHEIYDLALKEKPPQWFEHHLCPGLGPKMHKPEHPDHPVRSMNFLKHAILPVLANANELKMRPVKRTPLPNARTSATVWAWTKLDPASPQLVTKRSQKPENRPTDALGLRDDLDHLNKRRRLARLEKTPLYLESMKKRAEEIRLKQAEPMPKFSPQL